MIKLKFREGGADVWAQASLKRVNFTDVLLPWKSDMKQPVTSWKPDCVWCLACFGTATPSPFDAPTFSIHRHKGHSAGPNFRTKAEKEKAVGPNRSSPGPGAVCGPGQERQTGAAHSSGSVYWRQLTCAVIKTHQQLEQERGVLAGGGVLLRSSVFPNACPGPRRILHLSLWCGAKTGPRSPVPRPCCFLHAPLGRGGVGGWAWAEAEVLLWNRAERDSRPGSSPLHPPRMFAIPPRALQMPQSQRGRRRLSGETGTGGFSAAASNDHRQQMEHN